MSKNYKPSMFNYMVEDENILILYNSFVGVRSILVVSEQNKNRVKNILTQELTRESLGDIGTSLAEHGFMVPSDENEKTKRDFLFSQIVNSNTLELEHVDTKVKI